MPYKDVIAVVSPPYLEPQNSNRQGGINKHKSDCECNFCKKNKNNAGNIQGYKEMVGIVSPPYQDSEIAIKQGEDVYPEGRKKRRATDNWSDYSQNPQNIGNLKDKGFVGITSPPYENTQHDSSQDIDLILERLPKDSVLYQRIKNEETRGKAISEYLKGKYSDNKQNIGNLKDTSFVGITSPPYEKDITRHRPSGESPMMKSEEWKAKNIHINYTNDDNPENLGNQQGTSYLEAMLQVYKEASKVCPVICTITKNPTRVGKLRRLDLDTAKLLELSGYRIVDFHRAVLFKTFEQQTLTGKTKKEYKGRLSFFKRLSLQKGNTASEWEDIIIGIKNV